MHTLTAYYRPDNYPDWVLWRKFEQQFNLIGKPGVIDLGGVPTAQPGFAPRVSFGKPADDCDQNTKRRLRRGFEFQVRLTGNGHVILDRFRLHGQQLTERSTAKIL